MTNEITIKEQKRFYAELSVELAGSILTRMEEKGGKEHGED